MVEQSYDPDKRRERYERTKQLKGRETGSSKSSSDKSNSFRAVTPIHNKTQASLDRVIRVREKVNKLKTVLSEAQSELSAKRQKARVDKKKSSDGKATAEEKQSSQEYRDKHKTDLSSMGKKDTKSSSGGSSKSSSSVADMSIQDLQARVIKIRGALRDARRLLSNASLEHGQLAHSAIVSEPDVNERFARFTSAERGPST